MMINKKPLPHIHDLLKLITDDTLILTGNKRLARTIAQLHHDEQVQQSRQAWPTLPVMPLVTWLENCFQQTESPIILLNTAQERVLWQSIIESSHSLISTTETAYYAQQAWHLFKQWQLTLEDSRLKNSEECTQFISWAKTFKKQCQENHLLDLSSLPEYLLNHPSWKIPKHIILVGFLEVTPNIKKLLAFLQANHCQIDKIEIEHLTQNKHTITFPDHLTEIYTMARWAKQRLIDNPKSSIGCIVPTLNEYREEINRIFNEVFESDYRSFNLSSGTALLDEPIIFTAFKILQLSITRLSTSDLSYLLRSPFLGDYTEEKDSRALLDFIIQEIGNPHYDRSTLITLLHQHKKANKLKNKKLIERLKNIKELDRKKSLTPSEWSKIFSQILFTMGWPGKQPLNSREYQTIDHWKTLLQEFGQLNILNKTYLVYDAFLLLKQLAARMLFQIQTESAAIQVLGMLEAIDIPFTDTWIMGLNDREWPAPARPNPLLPVFLQRELNMPHASSERELVFCEVMMKQFLSNSRAVIFSYAQQSHPQETNASALIRDYPPIDITQLKLAPTTCLKEKNSKQILQNLTDDIAPPVKSTEKISGGSSILKYQAACPFQAFAKIRCHLDEINEPEIGFNAKERGIILHRSLELIWNKIRSHQTLCHLENEALSNILQQCIQQAINETIQHKTIHPEFVQLEQERCENLLEKWLSFEKTRKPFKVVAQERWQQIKIDRLSLRIRVDRIDQTEDNETIIIDYKTGKTDIQSWLTDRPSEPQLPLYTISHTSPIHAISFAQIRSNEITFKSLSKYKNILFNNQILSEIQWTVQMENWKITLNELAKQFLNGGASVDPKNRNISCRFCQLETLCRIDKKL